MALKKIALGAALTLWAGLASADPVLGTWKTQPGDDGNFAHVAISACGSDICGTIAKAFDGSGSSIETDTIGRQMVWGMQSRGDGTYRGGKIWAPDRDKTYNSRMTLSGNSLKVEGCVLGICRGQTWSRVN